MPEQKVRLIKWIVVTDKTEYVMTEKQKDEILLADRSGARFIQIDNAVLNIAFIKEIYRKVEHKDLQFSTLSAIDRKFLSKDDRKQLS